MMLLPSQYVNHGWTACIAFSAAWLRLFGLSGHGAIFACKPSIPQGKPAGAGEPASPPPPLPPPPPPPPPAARGLPPPRRLLPPTGPLPPPG